MKRIPKDFFQWDEETGESVYILYKEHQCFIGSSLCHPQDKDMQSEKTGITIAEHRALIKYYIYKREKILVQLKALKDYYYSINNNKLFDSDFYSVRILKNKIKSLQEELQGIRKELSSTRSDLYHYLKDKDNLYFKIRKKKQNYYLKERGTADEIQ